MDIGVLVTGGKGSSHMLSKKSSRMMLRLPEADAEMVKKLSEAQTRTFGDQLLFLIREGIKAGGYAVVNSQESKPGPQKAEISSKERKRA